MSYKGAIVTGRGGVGNARAGPSKFGQAVMETHPQTASILAQHEANIIAYERAVIARHKEAKANRPRVSGRGGLGNITESDPRSEKPLRRASLFKGGGDFITSLSSPKDRTDMNAYDEQERIDYARGLKGINRRSRASSTITVNTLSPSRPTFLLTSDSISEVGSSDESSYSISHSPPSITTTHRSKHTFANVWRKVSFSRHRRASAANDHHVHMDLLHRAERVTQSLSHLPLPPTLDISRDAMYSVTKRC